MDGRVGTALVQIRAKIRWPILRGEGSYEFWSTILQKLSDPGCSGITGMIYTVHISVYNRPILHTMSHVCSWSISKLTPFYQRVHTHTPKMFAIFYKSVDWKIINFFQTISVKGKLCHTCTSPRSYDIVLICLNIQCLCN